MGWVRVDDAFYDHPKFYEVNAIGVALWVSSLAYANRNLTDGFIPESALSRLINLDGVDVQQGMYGREAVADDAAAQLIAAGIWEAEERGYRIVNYLEFQPSADEVKAKREQNALRQAQFKRRRSGNAVSNAVSDDATNAEVTHAPNPNPNPNPNPEAEERPAKRAKPRSRIPADWTPSDELIAVMNAKHPGIDAASLVDRFRDFHISKGSLMADWNAAFRTWCGKERPQQPASLDQRRAWIAALTDEDIA